MLLSRAFLCQVLAVRLVRLIAGEKGGREELFVEVLTPLFKSIKNQSETESGMFWFCCGFFFFCC